MKKLIENLREFLIVLETVNKVLPKMNIVIKSLFKIIKTVVKWLIAMFQIAAIACALFVMYTSKDGVNSIDFFHNPKKA